VQKLARALVEYETLDLEEVKKVVRGERIRGTAAGLEAGTAAGTAGEAQGG
jgi:hypothetical protein